MKRRSSAAYAVKPLKRALPRRNFALKSARSAILSSPASRSSLIPADALTSSRSVLSSAEDNEIGLCPRKTVGSSGDTSTDCLRKTAGQEHGATALILSGFFLFPDFYPDSPKNKGFSAQVFHPSAELASSFSLSPPRTVSCAFRSLFASPPRAEQTMKFHLRWDFTHVTADATGPREDLGFTFDFRYRHELSVYAIRPRKPPHGGKPSA